MEASDSTESGHFQYQMRAKLLNNAQSTHGWVLYDDSCGFCRRWIRFWSATLRQRGYGIAPLQSRWVSEQLRLSEDAMVQDLRPLLSDRTQVNGADVYRHLMKRIWWAYPLFLLATAPVLRRLFDPGYRTFATNRYRVSRACRLAAPTDLHSLTDGPIDIPHR